MGWATGKVYKIECGVNQLGNDLSSAPEPDLESCVESCGAVPGCTAISWQHGTRLCFYKSTVDQPVADLTYDSAASADLSCPNADGVSFIDATGYMYQVQCNTFFPSSNNITSSDGGQDLADCAMQCSTMSDCTGATYMDSSCTFFSDPGSNDGTSQPGITSLVLLSKRLVLSGLAEGSTDRATSTPAVVPSYSMSRRELSIITNSMPTTTLPGLSSTSVSVTLPTRGPTISADSLSTSLPSGSIPTVSLSSLTLSSSSLSIGNSVTVLSTSVSLPSVSLDTDTGVSVSLPSVTTSGPSASVTLPSASGSLNTDLSLSLPTTSASASVPSVNTGLTATTPSVSGSEPSISVSLPSTSVDTALSSPSGSTLLPFPSSLSGLPSMGIDPNASPTPGASLSSSSVSRPTGIPLSLASTVTILSSATVPTSAAPTQTTPAYSCADNDGEVINENGYEYVLSCSNDTTGNFYSSRFAANNFNDCFLHCDQSSTSDGAQYCTAFTYVGMLDGKGPGMCYLKNSVGESTMPGPSHYVAAVRLSNYAGRAVVGAQSNSYPSTALPTNPATIPAASTTGPLPTSASSLADVSNAGSMLSDSNSASLPAMTGSPPITTPSISASVPTGFAAISATASIDSLTTSGVSSAVAGVTGTTISSPAAISCANGGNILNGCIIATVTDGVGAGVSGGIGLNGPSSSTILDVQISAAASVSLSLDASLGIGVSIGSSGIGIGVSGTLGAGVGATVGAGLSGALGGLGGLGGASTPASALSSPTPTAPSVSTTTIQSITTVTSCSTGLGGLVTCPGGVTISSVRSISITVLTSSCSTELGGSGDHHSDLVKPVDKYAIFYVGFIIVFYEDE
ncbi:uncharacterized protein LTR77_009701 [Saxophila tyrrhenica]|uniref:Apple domain-containing protein n=1 Tax=Saxophila tyrrhenica TaxID=1690608 RepID=A0AAV9NZM1_9PEZI|nr:hypothetical protein LTR77_009701 [Saxophila tyrrhenica]